MTAILKRSFGPYTVSLYMGKQTEVTGINSNLQDGSHIVMWEFDSPEPSNMLGQLRLAQQYHCLSDIHIARSSEGGGYHAYCFTALPWIYSMHVVSGTGGVDPGYISMCAMRGHWTLRTSDKGRGAPQHWLTLPSNVPPDCDKHDLIGGVNYKVWERKNRRPSTTATCTTCGFPTPPEPVIVELAGILAQAAASTVSVISCAWCESAKLEYQPNPGILDHWICPACLDSGPAP